MDEFDEIASPERSAVDNFLRNGDRNGNGTGTAKRRPGRPRKTDTAFASENEVETLEARPKRKYTRRTKSLEIPTIALYPVIMTASSMLADRRGKHWEFSAQETEALAQSISSCLKHVPVDPQKLGIAADLFGLAVTLANIAIPRIQTDVKMLEKMNSNATSYSTATPN